MTKEEIKVSLLNFPNDWDELLKEEKSNDYFQKLIDKVSDEYMKFLVHPDYQNVYRALELVKPKDVKVVIIGQDPYFNPCQANGLAFSVYEGVKFPPSLRNIYKELEIEYGTPITNRNGSLDNWAKQGVLLLNSTLTVRDGSANSHAKFGWETFTDNIISKLDELDQPIVYLLWGNFAQKKEKLIHSCNAYLIKCAHPSPLSATRGFFNSNCFRQCNEHLTKIGKSEIVF